MKFWQWAGMVVVLLIIGGILVRLTYILKTGQDLNRPVLPPATETEAEVIPQ